tara:strand:- start:110 stop:391 length:282 start_codon:yes stop_codon:yes gene_type:complete
MSVRRMIAVTFCLCIVGAGSAFGGETEPAIGSMSTPERAVKPFDKTNPMHIQRYYDQLNKRLPVDRDGKPFPMGDGCLPPAPWLPLLMKPKIS